MPRYMPRYETVKNPQPGMLVVWTRPFGSDRRSMAILVKPDPFDDFYWHIITDSGKAQIALRFDFYYPVNIPDDISSSSHGSDNHDCNCVEDIDTLEGLTSTEVDSYYSKPYINHMIPEGSGSEQGE